MNQETAKKVIARVSLVWAILALILVGLALGKVLSRDQFEWVFAGGFVVWAIVTTALFQFVAGK